MTLVNQRNRNIISILVRILSVFLCEKISEFSVGYWDNSLFSLIKSRLKVKRKRKGSNLINVNINMFEQGG